MASLQEILDAIKAGSQKSYKIPIIQTKTVASAGAEGAGDVVSESISAGKAWTFDFGKTGYITKALIVSAANALTPLMTLFLYSVYPTCELRDNVANTQPVAADVPFLVGEISWEAMTSKGTGHSYAVATPSSYGKLPLIHSVPKVYGVLVDNTGATFGVTLVTIILVSDAEE